MKIAGTNIEDPATTNRSFSEIMQGLDPARREFSPDVLSWLRGDDIIEREGAKLGSPYSQSTWVYVAISCLAENVAQIPMRVSKIPQKAAKLFPRDWRKECGGAFDFRRKSVLGENIVESGEVVDLFNNPHPTMTRALFWESVISWCCLRGEFFVVPLDGMDQPVDLAARGGKVKRLLTLEPGLFWHVVVGYELEAWRYTGSPLLTPLPSEMLLPSEVIHYRTYNPYLYWRGMSPLFLAMLPAMSDYAASQFMKGLMMNNADTGVIATTEQNLTQEQREQFMAALRERKRKAGTPDRPLFLSSGVKIEKPTISNVDMEFLSSRKFSREEIFAVWKVPPSLAGIESQGASKGGQGSTSGGSQSQDRRVFIENTVTNKCRQLEASFSPLAKRFDPAFELWFDIDSLPIMQEARRDRLTAATAAFGLGVPLNDINQVYDLGFKKYPWGDEGYLPFNLQVAGEEKGQTEPGQDPNNPNNPETGDENTDPNEPQNPEQAAARNPLVRAERLLLSFSETLAIRARPVVRNPPHGYEQSIAGAEKAKAGRMRKFFFEQRGRVLAKLAKVNQSVLSAQDTRKKSIDDLWDRMMENLYLHQKLDPSIRTDLEFGGAQIMQEISAGVDFNLPPTEALEYLAKRKKAIDSINETTWDALKATLSDGLSAGDSISQLRDRVNDVYSAAGKARATTIAMTETNGAVNGGRQMAMTQAGIENKGWLTAHLETTRATHYANEAISTNDGGIPIDDTWPNGCDYPGDPAGDPSETINCHCCGYAIEPGKGAKPVKFLTWQEFCEAKAGKEAKK